MLQLNFIRENKDYVIERLKVKHFKNVEQIIGDLLEADNTRRSVQTESDKIKAEANSIAKQIGILYKQGKNDEAEALKAKTSEYKNKEKELAEQLTESEEKIKTLLLSIPNLPNKDVPEGFGAEDNITVLQKGEMPKLDSDAKPHWELCSEYDIVDFDLGNKITGAGFPVYKGKGAKLQRALINFFLDEAMKDGFTEVQPPLMVNENSAMVKYVSDRMMVMRSGKMIQIGEADEIYSNPQDSYTKSLIEAM